MAVQSFPLLGLAAELRHKIFEFFFQNVRVMVNCRIRDERSDGDDDDDDDDEYHYNTNRFSLFRVSKLIHCESIDAFVRKATFDFQLIDHYPTWAPNTTLMSYMPRIKHFYGPPRLLHRLHFTELQWFAGHENQGVWLDDCKASRVVCDMIVDQFDIHDAIFHAGNPEAIYFAGVKEAIVGPKSDILILAVQVEDGEPVWSGWDDSHVRTGFQVWNGKVVVRRKPRTEPGKLNLKNVLDLLGLKLEDRDAHIIIPVKGTDAVAANANAAPALLPTLVAAPTVVLPAASGLGSHLPHIAVVNPLHATVADAGDDDDDDDDDEDEMDDSVADVDGEPAASASGQMVATDMGMVSTAELAGETDEEVFGEMDLDGDQYYNATAVTQLNANDDEHEDDRSLSDEEFDEAIDESVNDAIDAAVEQAVAEDNDATIAAAHSATTVTAASIPIAIPAANMSDYLHPQ